MTSRLAEAVAEKIEHAGSLYHRLVLVLGPERSENATALKDIAERIDAPLINVGLELSRRLLDLAERQRRFRVPILLERLVATSEGEIVLLDNIELLFDSTLRQDPLAVLQRLSRRRTVVATWNGPMEDGHIYYAVPDHPEYRRYPVDGVLVAVAEATG